MSKTNKVYNKQYKDIKEVEAKITRTDNEHTNLKDANFMLDVRIPVKNRKITLNDVVDMMLDGFNKVNNRLDVIETNIHDLKKDVKDLQIRMTKVENRIENLDSRITNIVQLNGLKE
jgi:chromosome segregation ATPase